MSSKIQLATLKNPQPDHFFILDIDSTLLTTHQRNQAILDQFIMDNKEHFQEDCNNLAKAQCQLGDYGYHSALERIDFKEVNSGSLQALQDFWNTFFFSNDYLHNDVPTPGAVEWVQSLNNKNISFIYLTARHKETMWDGTLSSLQKMGFPISENNLFLKEDLSDSDDGYKSKTLEKILKQESDKEIIFVDNEPVVLNRVLKDFPSIRLVWFESTHSGKMEPPQEALRIDNFLFS